MEQETLFTASKWDILTELEKKRRSPVELAEILKTSVANISQQLRLLEMAGLVKSKRISNREKGLPRVLYSLAGNHSYLIAAAKEFVDKKFLLLTERNKVSMKIWFLDDIESHYYLEKAFWNIEENLNEVDAILLDTLGSDLKLVLISNSKLDIKDMKIKNPDGKERRVNVKIIKPSKFKKNERFYPLYDPEGLMQGGENNEG